MSSRPCPKPVPVCPTVQKGVVAGVNGQQLRGAKCTPCLHCPKEGQRKQAKAVLGGREGIRILRMNATPPSHATTPQSAQEQVAGIYQAAGMPAGHHAMPACMCKACPCPASLPAMPCPAMQLCMLSIKVRIPMPCLVEGNCREGGKLPFFPPAKTAAERLYTEQSCCHQLSSVCLPTSTLFFLCSQPHLCV